MKVLHVTEYCHAGSIGGTERYILDLISCLDAAGYQNEIVWLHPGTCAEPFDEVGVRISGLPAPLMRVDAPIPGFEREAVRLLDDKRPDWLHFHTFGLSEAHLARLARARGIRCAFTYHSPAWTCRRETMLLYGENPCDGEVRAWRCGACQVQGRLGTNRAGGHALAAASAAVGWLALAFGRTSLRRRAGFFYDSARFGRVIRGFLADCDLVVSTCDWSTPILKRNGAREQCLVQCPQGVPNQVADRLRQQVGVHIPPREGRFVVGYVGRVVEVKGVHILLQAFAQVKSDSARLRIVGYAPGNEMDEYSRHVRQLAEADPRVELVPRRGLADTFAEYQALSLLAVPSISMETGPFVLLEALALGLPVYGSSRVGQLRLLQEHGRIVDPNTPQAWKAVLTEALADYESGKWEAYAQHLRGVAALRTMTDVAKEMANCYSSIE